MRATILVEADSEDDFIAVQSWFDRWRESLSFVSENEGCGCCVHMWNVEGPEEAMNELDARWLCGGEWADTQ